MRPSVLLHSREPARQGKPAAGDGGHVEPMADIAVKIVKIDENGVTKERISRVAPADRGGDDRMATRPKGSKSCAVRGS